MEIYILRDGQETGPFSEEATQQMLKQGEVLITDLAWSPGFPEWIPLHGVLYPPPPQAHSIPDEPWNVDLTPAEPASPRQKAFLSYMGIPFPSEVSHDAAALLVNDALENPKNPARLSRWNEDRLKLHPDLFSDEIEAQKKARPIRYFEICAEDGAECFTGVSKAHCQVLVEYLDVKFPKWDVSEKEGAWNYFFPAVAEKFPDLVQKEWKGKLHYPQGPKVAKDVKRPVPMAPIVKRSPKTSAAGQLMKGIFYGIILLGLLVGGVRLSRNPEQLDALKSMFKGAPAEDIPVQAGAASPAPASDPASRHPALTPAPGAPLTPSSPFGGPAPTTSAAPGGMAPPATGDPSASTAAQMPPEPALPIPAAPSPEAGSSESLFGSPEPSQTQTPPVATATPAATPATPAPRINVVLTKAVVIQTAYGPVTVARGTPLRLVGQEGTNLKVQYMNTVVAVPASSTNFSEGMLR